MHAARVGEQTKAATWALETPFRFRQPLKFGAKDI